MAKKTKSKKPSKKPQKDTKEAAAERILKSATVVIEGIEKERKLVEDLVKVHEKLKQAVADRTSQAVETTRAMLTLLPPESAEAQLLGGVLNGLRRTTMTLHHWSFRKNVEEIERALHETAGHVARLRELNGNKPLSQ